MASRARRCCAAFLLATAACVGIGGGVAAPPEAGQGDGASGDDAVADEHDDDFVRRFQRGQRLLGSGADEEAEKLFRELIAERPEEASLHHAFAVLLQFRRRPDDATTAFVTAARLAPTEAVIRRDAGLHLVAVGRAADGEPHLSAACLLWPEDLESSVGRGAALRALGRVATAESEYRRAVALDSNSIDAAVGLAACLVETKPAEALELVERATGQWPDVLLVRGAALLRLERYEEAAASLEKVTAVAMPGAAGVAFLRGAAESLTLCGDARHAGVAAEKWFEIESASGAPSQAATLCVAMTREASGDHAGALAALDAAQSDVDAAESAPTKLLRAAVLVRSGHRDAAKFVLESIADSPTERFEHAAATRLLGRTTAADFAKLVPQPGLANDVAWIESLSAEMSGDVAAASAFRVRAAELSRPPGEFPGMLVRPWNDKIK